MAKNSFIGYGQRPWHADYEQLSECRDREQELSLTPYFGNKLREILGNSEWESIIQFRMGYPTFKALPSPRRPEPPLGAAVFVNRNVGDI